MSSALIHDFTDKLPSSQQFLVGLYQQVLLGTWKLIHKYI